jgi:uncharacterized protein (DUF427 family)
MTLDLDAQDRAGPRELRVRAVVKRVRASHGGTTVVDSTRPRLVWEPRRVVASYAVPEEDVLAELVPHEAESGGSSQPVLDPRVPFTVHTAPGEPLSVRLPDGMLAEGAAFRLADPEVAGLVVLGFDAFDWLDEDEPLVSHPRDPCHRIDVCRSGRTVRIEREGRVLAESSRALWLFEGTFGWVRYYLPHEDVVVPLEKDDSRPTYCAYKGRATYWSVPGDDPVLDRIAWSYEEPLHDAEQVAGLVSFFTERLDLSIDGTPVPRVWTPWTESS